MGILGLIISIIVVGLIAGAVARLLVPGKQSLSIPMTILLGIIGSFVGGFLGFLISSLFGGGGDQQSFLQPAGIIGSIIGAIIVLLLWIRFGSKSRRA